MVAGTMVAAEAHARHCIRMGADPDRAGRPWARGILLSIVAIFVLGWLWPDPNGNMAGGPGMWLMIGVVVLGLPVLFVMMRFTPRKGGPVAGWWEGLTDAEIITRLLQGSVVGTGPSVGYTIQAASVVDGTIRDAGGEAWADVDLILSNGAAVPATFHAIASTGDWEWWAR
jgi:hypothetical protein